jgi:spermidine synthase
MPAVRRPAAAAALLFGSGFCALIYQTVWFRQFRLIFGVSTFATAAVLAIFMGGLGLGSAWLGRRADRHPRPLELYGNLELLIALSAAISPALLWLIAKIYFAVGGSVSLGLFLSTIVRLVLSALVLAAPTVLMGGTLPAVARAVESSDDEGRRRLALLYGVNTLGAVAGTLTSTFYMLEVFGSLRTLFVAVLVNLLVGITARSLGRMREGFSTPSGAEDGLAAADALRTRPTFVLVAAFVVGFAFLLMELVWYRMLGPLLGGSTFTFGLILAIALFGIGLGGAAYAFWGGRRRATPAGFALTCSLEAAFLALPFVLGDRIAVYQLYLRGLGTLGFPGHVVGWTLITLVVVFPAAFVAGVQFPLLISLLGAGEEGVGRHVGLAYAWNTAGAIAGSLAGGFGLLPLLTAPGTWKLVVVLLAITAIVMRKIVPSAIAVLAVVVMFVVLGPTAVWRHSGIGAGRARFSDSLNRLRDWENGVRRMTVWSADGRESSVALVSPNDYAFVVNGKTDGSARGDAGTQIMAGLVGAAIHQDPRRALVIGLGTGSTAGWLGAIPRMDRVDVVELEPAVLHVAEACTPVNHDVLHNRKVHIHIGDAREVLLATSNRYDIIFSEPSNPYRAGIASLFTEEFYRAAAARLNPGGVFSQWVQAYDVDAQTIRTIYATMGTVFPYIDTWHTTEGDLLLVAAKEPRVIDVDMLRARLRQPPFLAAMSNAWRMETVEGFLGHFMANDTLASAIAQSETQLNTDDRTLVEFGFARGLGNADRFNMGELAQLARARNADRPLRVRGTVDWNALEANRASVAYVDQLPLNASPELQARRRAAIAYAAGDLNAVVTEWRAHSFPPVNTGELTMIAEALAEAGSASAEAYAAQLRPWRPGDADVILARLRFRQARIGESAELLARGFIATRKTPWSTQHTMERAHALALEVAASHAYAQVIFNALNQPFTAGQWNDVRTVNRVQVGRELQGCGPLTIGAIHAIEPWVPWTESLLRLRRDCYQSTMDPRANAARRDYEEFMQREPIPLLSPETRSPSGSSSGPR